MHTETCTGPLGKPGPRKLLSEAGRRGHRRRQDRELVGSRPPSPSLSRPRRGSGSVTRGPLCASSSCWRPVMPAVSARCQHWVWVAKSTCWSPRGRGHVCARGPVCTHRPWPGGGRCGQEWVSGVESGCVCAAEGETGDRRSPLPVPMSRPPGQGQEDAGYDTEPLLCVQP